MSPDYFLFFFIGLVRRGFLPVDNDGPATTSYATSSLNHDVGDEAFCDNREEQPLSNDTNQSFYNWETLDPTEGTLPNEETAEAKKEVPKDLNSKRVSHNNSRDNDEKQENNSNNGGNRMNKNKNNFDDDIIPKETILHECLEYCSTFENDFDVDQIHRVGRILRYHGQYSYISTMLPTSWEVIINEVMIMGK